MSKKVGIVIAVVAVTALCLSLVNLYLSLTAPKEEEADIQYVMYLGTNDKNTNEPVFTPEEAKAKAKEILVKYFGGYTLQEADGGWEDDGILYQEYTLVIYLRFQAKLCTDPKKRDGNGILFRSQLIS